MSTLDPEGLEKAKAAWPFNMTIRPAFDLDGNAVGTEVILLVLPHQIDLLPIHIREHARFDEAAITAYLQHKAAAVPQADELAKAADFELAKVRAFSKVKAEAIEWRDKLIAADAELAKVKADDCCVHARMAALRRKGKIYTHEDEEIARLKGQVEIAKAAAEAECARLRDALTPFGELVGPSLRSLPDNDTLLLVHTDGRRMAAIMPLAFFDAAAALASPPAKEDDNAGR